jgi:hypothetical protein
MTVEDPVGGETPKTYVRARPRYRETLTTPRTSRFWGGPTTLAPATRICLTLLLVALLPWGPFTAVSVFYLLAYLPIATVVLVATWGRGSVGPSPLFPRSREATTPRTMRSRTTKAQVPKATVAFYGTLALVFLALVAVWIRGGDVARFTVVSVACFASVVTWFSWTLKR